MKAYMIQDTRTGLWYRKGPSHLGNWSRQEEAAIWTTKAGPNGAVGRIEALNGHMARFGPAAIREPKIITLSAVRLES